MRIRAMIAALAVAFSLALCVVPAYADTEEYVYDVTYPNIDIYYYPADIDYDPLVGVYRDQDGLYVLTVANAVSSNPYWDTFINNQYITSETPTNSPFYIPDDSDITHVRGLFSYVDSDGVTHNFQITFRINEHGISNNMNGVFGVASQGIGSFIDNIHAWINAIKTNPVLLLFCFALPLLTIGITIIKRLLSVR